MYHTTTWRDVSACQMRSGLPSRLRSAIATIFQPSSPTESSQPEPWRALPCGPPMYHASAWRVASVCHIRSAIPSPLKSCVNAGEKAVTVNGITLVAVPPPVTTILPVVAASGTRTVMLVADQLVGVPGVPLNLIVLVPCVVPKPSPPMTTTVPGCPTCGPTLMMVGAVGVTGAKAALGTLVPALLVAVTVNVYGIPLLSPSTVKGLALPVAVRPPGAALTV